MTTTTTASATKTIAFFGATGGCGLSALRYSLAEGYTCRALCRTPAKLTALLSESPTSNLVTLEGNAHDAVAVEACLTASPTSLVDTIVFSIGGAFVLSKMSLDDPDVCRRGIETVLTALTTLREKGVTGQPRLLVVSTTGISRFGRDIPIAMLPLYKGMLKVPHEDKKAMEQLVEASGEAYT